MFGLVRCSCERVGTRKIFKSSFHSLKKTFVARFNITMTKHIRALSVALQKIGTNLWLRHVSALTSEDMMLLE